MINKNGSNNHETSVSKSDLIDEGTEGGKADALEQALDHPQGVQQPHHGAEQVYTDRVISGLYHFGTDPDPASSKIFHGSFSPFL